MSIRMSARYWIAILLCILFFLGCAEGELFSSQEYGITFDYAKDLAVSFASNQISLTGAEGISIGITKVDFSSTIKTLDDLARESENTIGQVAQDLKTLNRDELKIDGKNALLKEYSFTVQTGDQQISEKMKCIYIDKGDSFMMLMFACNEYYFGKADKIYFTPLTQSVKLFSTKDYIEDCIRGFPKYTSAEIWSSPLVADIDGDGSLDVVVGTNENELHAWSKNGTELKGFPFPAENLIASSPAWGDLNGDGKNEIIFASDDGNIYAINGKGDLLAGFPRLTEGAIRSSPALGDINGDGTSEIVIGSKDTGVYSIDKSGSKVCGFPVITGVSSIGGIWSSAALGDINEDGKLEVIIGATKLNSELSDLFDMQVASGFLFAVNGTGEPIDGFPVGLGTGSALGYSSPVLADINDDGHLEILVGTSQGLQCLDWQGKNLDGFPIEVEGTLQDSFITVGDLENDGKIEIVSGCDNGKLYVWKADGSDYPGFPIQTGGSVRYVSLGDIDNDGNQEMLGGSSDNRVHCWKLDGSEAPGFPKATMDNIQTAPTLADLDKDGSLELIVGSDDRGLYVWRISGKFGQLQWPMFRQNAEHTGLFKI